VAAMNPPSEVFRSKSVSWAEEQKFRKKLSGPIMDRIDLWTEVAKIEHSELTEKNNSGESSEKIRERVLKAREIQKKRFGKGKLNAEMSARDIQNLIELKPEVKKTLEDAALAMDFSPRVFHKMIKLARTIADLDGEENIEQKHILEALQYRPKDII
jgi:magnesium chelatase family protein